MNHLPGSAEHPHTEPSFWRRPAGKAWITAGLVGGFFLLREHWGHLLGLWPYLVLLACPLMHLMHGHHGGHHGHHDHRGGSAPDRDVGKP